MNFLPPRSLRIAVVVFLVALCVFEIRNAETQVSEDAVTESYKVFTQLAGVYSAGGEAPSLVAKLNSALELIAESRYRRSIGDDAGASKLDDQSRAMMAEVAAQIPAAIETARRDSALRRIIVIAWIPVVVAILTFGFHVALRVWRWYEKAKLYEMRIVEKKKDQD